MAIWPNASRILRTIAAIAALPPDEAAFMAERTRRVVSSVPLSYRVRFAQAPDQARRHLEAAQVKRDRKAARRVLDGARRFRSDWAKVTASQYEEPLGYLL
jgi:hypothetical protein